MIRSGHRRIRGIQLKLTIRELANLSASEFGTELLAIEPKHIDRIRELPFHHRDSFDRRSIAQALQLKAAIIGKDSAFDPYGIERVW